MEEMRLEAIISNVVVVTEFVNTYLKKNNCPNDVIVKIDIAIDEVFSNIANYAYGDSVGKVTVKVSYDDAECKVTVAFEDEGIAYNPLAKEDPDMARVLDDDSIGGLGVFLTKSLMDDITYHYNNGKNILIIYKKTSDN